MPQIKLSELRAGLQSGKITDDDVTKLKAAGYDVLNDEGAGSQRPEASGSTPPPAQGGMIDRLKSNFKEGVKNVSDAYVGAGKGIIDTAYNVGKFVTHNPLSGTSPIENPDLEDALQAKTGGEKVGKFIERAAEFMAGDAGVKAGMEAIPLLARGTGLLAKLAKSAASGAISGGAVTKAQGGTNEEAATNAVVGGVLAPAVEASGMVARKLATKLELSHIRPTAGDYANGFKNDTLEKYGLQGMSLNGTLDSVHQKITDLAGELRNVTQNAPGSIDLGNVLADTENELLSRTARLKNAGDVSNMKAAIDKFTGEAADLGGQATVDEAQTLKRAVGLKGAWSYGKSDADSAMETVANVYQKNLKTAIENATPPGAVKGINQQLSELMPVEQALVRRIPVAARNNPLSLTDLMLLATGHPAGAAVHVGSKTMGGSTLLALTGRAAQAMAKPVTAGVQSAVSGE